MGKRIRACFIFAILSGSAILRGEDGAGSPPDVAIVVSVAEQKLALLKDGGLVRKYPISTSKFGIGDSFNSYRTPLGRLRVCDKIGDDLALGAVLKSRSATGEILPANAPGRDPIVTRILWLEGLDSCNSNAKSRGIYIHGTVEESKLGQPMSYGCIRMRSRDVVEVFDFTPVGTPVQIIPDRFPRYPSYAPKPEILVASAASADTTVTTATIGPHGMVIVKTSPAASSKAPVVEAAKAPEKPVVALAAAKPADASKKLPAQPVAKEIAKLVPASIAEGPKLVFSTPKLSASAARPAAQEGDAAPAEPRVILAMSSSILMSGLEPKAKPAPAAAPTASVPPAPAPVQPAVAADVPSPRNLFLEIATAPDLFVKANGSLDTLSGHLLNPPQPQLHLAFRTSIPEPEL